MSQPLRIAIIGARGIPGFYGGFETFATELAPRLVERGHHVTVYCHPRYSLPDRPVLYHGVQLQYTSTFQSKFFETPIHELFSLKDALRRRFDVLYVLAFRSSVLYVLPKLMGKRIVMNTDGLDWKRSKWNRIGRTYLKFSEMVGVRMASTGLIADSRGMQDYIRESYGHSSQFIPYGAPIVHSVHSGLIAKYGLEPRSYFLVVARMEPENNVHVAVAGFEKLKTDKRLVVVGGANHESKYFATLRATRDPRVIFTGPIYDNALLNELWCNCFAYIHGHQVGGTNPSLLQAMGCGCVPVVRDVNFNGEVVKDIGVAWKPEAEDLAAKLGQLLQYSTAELDGIRARARARILQEYNWERVADDHERYFQQVCSAEIGAAANLASRDSAEAHD